MVENTAKWGRRVARERYGESRAGMGPPPDRSHPQKLGDSNNLQGPDHSNDHANDWVRGGPKESAEGKPGFDRSK